MKNKIDCVIPFVDMNDKEWYSKYIIHLSKNQKNIDLNINHDGRFRDNKTLRYLLRGINKYLPWINNVFLVVQSESQVPKWINRETVKVVLHEEFIPKEYLPVYNGLFLQLFFHKIKGLSDRYICVDDDMLFVDNVSSYHFFNSEKNVHFIRRRDLNGVYSNKGYFYPVYNANRIVNEVYTELTTVSDHGVLAFNKHENNTFFNKTLYQHINDIDRVIRDKKSIICWVYLMNNYNNRKIIVEKTPLCKSTILRKKEIDDIIKYILESKYKVICINDYNIEKWEYDIVHKKLIQCLNMKFKETCKYEREN